MKIKYLIYRLRAKFVLLDPGTDPLDDPGFTAEKIQRPADETAGSTWKIFGILAIVWVLLVICWAIGFNKPAEASAGPTPTVNRTTLKLDGRDYLPEPTQTPTATPTATPTPTQTPTPTLTLESTPRPQQTRQVITPTPTRTPSDDQPTQQPTQQPAQQPGQRVVVVTQIVVEVIEVVITATPAPTPTPTQTPTSTPTVSAPTPTPTPTWTPMPPEMMPFGLFMPMIVCNHAGIVGPDHPTPTVEPYP